MHYKSSPETSPNALESGRFCTLSNHIKHYQCHTNTNKHIGNVESRPVVVAPVNIDEVDNLANAYTVYQVANSTGKNH